MKHTIRRIEPHHIATSATNVAGGMIRTVIIKVITPNGFADIIHRLEKQKVAIDRALAALREVGDDTVKAPAAKRPAKKAGRVTRTLSPEARERIAEAQRARWAVTKKTAKTAAKKAR